MSEESMDFIQKSSKAKKPKTKAKSVLKRGGKA